jgi:ribosomal-protein-alanine N-acetyltransferase
MTVVIRPMQMRDLPAVVEIDRMSFSLPWPEGSFRYELTGNRAARCLVAETEDHRIAAMIVSWIILDELHIATFATHPEFRRHRLGSQLLSQALADARAEGAQRAFLEVRAGNLAAQAMYGKFGFEVTGRRTGYYRDNGETALMMTLGTLELTKPWPTIST